MATPATFDGLLAHPTIVNSGSSNSFFSPLFSKIYIEFSKIRGTSKVQPVGSIQLPLPTGCPFFYDYSLHWLDDGYLLVKVIGSTTSGSSQGSGNNNRGQLSKYRVSDDGDVQLIWRSDETPLLLPTNMDLPVIVARDGAWGIWCGDSVVDMGTGKVTFQDLYHPSSASNPNALDFNAQHSYFPSPLIGCLSRSQLTAPTYSPFGGIYSPSYPGGSLMEAVDSAGNVLRSANWKGLPQSPAIDSVNNLGGIISRPYKSDICYVAYTHSTHDSFASRYIRFEFFDPSTYIPTDTAPSVYYPFQDTSPAGLGISRLPGGGFDYSTPGSYGYLTLLAERDVPLKDNGKGQLDASLNPSSVLMPSLPDTDLGVGSFSGGTSHGLDLYVSSARAVSHPRWRDADGNIGPLFDSFVLQNSNPGIYLGTQFAFRPVLPSTIITGVIDDSRRLFTPV